MSEKPWKQSLTAVAATTILITTASIARADITWSGDLDPADPTTWTSDTVGCVGNIADGTLTIDGDSDLLTRQGEIGDKAGVTGEVNVDGTGSTWTSSRRISVGGHGSGTLAITNGGAVSSCDSLISIFGESTGEVTVDDSGSTWTNNGLFIVGFEGNGLVNITNGGVVKSDTGTAKCIIGSIGYQRNSTGEVNVIGNGSKWVHKGILDVGTDGSGLLNITDGGEVIVKGTISVSYNPGSSGTIHFDNGSLTTDGLNSSMADLTGMGKVFTHGLISDVNLIFDATHGMSQTFSIHDNPGQNIEVNLNADGTSPMGAGFSGSGTMHITDGIKVESTSGNIGYHSGSMGLVAVNGTGSTWTNKGNLSVGLSGSGVMNISNGGLVCVRHLLIDYNQDGDSFINMSTGGKLALFGEADNSLTEFLDLINGTDAIHYWDDSISDWADISGATYGLDYTLEYITDGDLNGYTLLTVGIPEPSAVVIVVVLLCALVFCQQHQEK
ncbi:MAG: hypothetical protein JW829_10410 [Pirellulales bacterium]|nr:hypothetical protein [Pirellulales bacterium]